MTIFNLTQHSATEEQINAGVKDLDADLRMLLKKFLTFEDIPSSEKLQNRADFITAMLEAQIMRDDDGEFPERRRAMIGGAPFFMRVLEEHLLGSHIEPMYAFSVRESVEHADDDGIVIKRNVFRHKGFVRPYH